MIRFDPGQDVDEAGNPQPTFVAYHRNFPHGVEYNVATRRLAGAPAEDAGSLTELAEKGWVGHPAYIGLNPWSASEETIARLQAQFENGEKPAFDYSTYAEWQEVRDTLLETQEERQIEAEEMHKLGRLEQAIRSVDEAKHAKEMAEEKQSRAKRERAGVKNPIGANITGAVRQQKIAHSPPPPPDE